MKQLALVTCVYDLVKRGSMLHRTVDWMLSNAGFVLAQDRELVIFTDPGDPDLEAELRRVRGDPPYKNTKNCPGAGSLGCPAAAARQRIPR